MSSSLDSVDTLLPARLSAADAVTLSRALLIAFDSDRGHDGSVRELARTLRDESDALRVAWEAKLRASIAADHGDSARRADTDEDAVWLALHLWLKGWAALPKDLAPEHAIAQATLDALFPDGTTFTQLSYALEWAEADRRIALLDAEGHAACIEKLGGTALLHALRRAHAEYERALGMSHRASVPPSPTNDALAPLVDAVGKALGGYVSGVVNETDRSNTDGVARSETWLAPLRRWADERARRAVRG